MKKKLCIITACLMVLTLAAGCRTNQDVNENTPGVTETPAAEKLTLSVVSTIGENDSKRTAYEAAYREWETETGNAVSEIYGIAHEDFMADIHSSFEDGNEPDVMYYFNGTYADAIVNGGRVVPLTEIVAEFPGFAGEHDLRLIPVSTADGIAYAVPLFGHWELMYVNKAVLEACGVDIPDENTTWEEFIGLCETIKEHGYVPIAVSLHDAPNYLFEYAVFNHSGIETHPRLPEFAESETNAAGTNWIAGLEDMRLLYERDFFPENTLTATDAETFSLMYSDRAAFAIDGSWRIGDIELEAENPDNFTVTFVPGTEARKSSDIIAGLSSGWYITRKAWDDPERRNAAVSFVQKMISRDTIASYGAEGMAVTLNGGPIAPENPSALRTDSIDILSRMSGSAPAARELLVEERRSALFSDVGNVMTGNVAPEHVIRNAFVTEE